MHIPNLPALPAIVHNLIQNPDIQWAVRSLQDAGQHAADILQDIHRLPPAQRMTAIYVQTALRLAAVGWFSLRDIQHGIARLRGEEAPQGVRNRVLRTTAFHLLSSTVTHFVTHSARTRQTLPMDVQITQVALQALTYSLLDLGANWMAGNWAPPEFSSSANHRAAAALADPKTLSHCLDHYRDLFNQWENEANFDSFRTFLERLCKGTVNSQDPAFRADVRDWLSHLADDPDLRRDTFAASLTATQSCEDRVTLAYNQMRGLRIASEVQKGLYDKRLPELLGLARGMFRLSELEKIARQKVTELMREPRQQDENPIEGHLAYQIGLRERLQLPITSTRMRFGKLSGVTIADFDNAYNRIMDMEKAAFPAFLAVDWAPWQSVMKRLDPEGHARMNRELEEAMDSRFSEILFAQLKADNLENDPDAERIVGVRVLRDITEDIMGRHARLFLEARGLSLAPA